MTHRFLIALVLGLAIPSAQAAADACKFPMQGEFASKQLPGEIDCNVATAAFPGVSADPIRPFDECWHIDNESANTYFVPLKTFEEWHAFKTHTPNGVTLRGCVPEEPETPVAEPDPPSLPPSCPFEVVEIGDQIDYNLFQDLKARGCDMTKPLNVTVVLTSNSIIGTNSANAAFRTGTGFHADSQIKFVISPNAYIVGAAGGGANGEGTSGSYGDVCAAGGAGGPAMRIQFPIAVENLGTIAGGGGGGARYGCANCNWGGYGGFAKIVSGGGMGAGTRADPYYTSGDLLRGGYAYFYATWDWNGPGVGVGGGVNGGGWGEPGENHSCGASGGAAGAAVIGNSKAAWIATGQRFGAIRP